MKRHLTNAACGALDYASYPVGMLLVAPVVLHRLGAAEYGLWIITTSIISAGGIIASGFSDAGIQRIGELRGSGDLERISEAVRGMLGINLVLGSVMAVLTWVAAPWIATRVAVAHVIPEHECLDAIRIASIGILLRAFETVGVSTLRAFEEYRVTVQISTATRLLTLVTAAVLAFFRHRTVSILLVTAAFLLLGACMQFREARRFLRSGLAAPGFHGRELRLLLHLGFFAWLRAVGNAIFGQVDRILLGISFGAVIVAPYALCVQFAQPLSNFTASSLHFLFPYLSGQTRHSQSGAFRRALLRAFLCNLLMVSVGATLLALLSKPGLRLLAGPAVAQNAAGIVAPIVAGSALVGLSVTGTYAMQAMGWFRTLACISLASHSAMLLAMLFLLHRDGLNGLAFSRLVYGIVALLVYLPLFQRLKKPPLSTRTAVPTVGRELLEG